MKCPYIYQSGDHTVNSGKNQVGDICGVRLGSEEYGGYCFPHGVKMGTVPREVIEKKKKRHKDSLQEKRDRRNEADSKAQENMSGPEIKLNPRVLEALGLDKPCNLDIEYAEIKVTNNWLGKASYDEKYAFARWLGSPKHLRNPKTMAEAAKILGVTEKTLISWTTAPEVLDFINMDTESRSRGLFPLAIYKLGENIDKNDTKSIIDYLKYKDEQDAKRQVKTRSLDPSPEEQKEADDFARALGERNRGVALKAEKSMVQANIFKGVSEETGQ